MKEVISDPTGNIKPETETSVYLLPGYYKINYFLSATLPSPGYIQITPVYNGTFHFEYVGIVNTTTDNELAIIDRTFIIQVSSRTRLFFTYNSPFTASNGNATFTIEKLDRTLPA